MRKQTAFVRKIVLTCRLSARNRLVYPGTILAGMFKYGLFVYVFSRVWLAAFAGRETISGYTYAACVWYFALAEVVMCAFNSSIFRDLAHIVRTGDVAYRLLRPIGFLAHFWAERTGPALVEAAIYLAEGFLICSLVTGWIPPLGPLEASVFLVSLLLAFAIALFFQSAIALTAFSVEENAAFSWIWQKIALVAGTLLPLEFLPAWLSGITVWTPFPYQTWAPARMLVSFDPRMAVSALASQVAWAAIGAGMCVIMFVMGRGKIQSTGG